MASSSCEGRDQAEGRDSAWLRQQMARWRRDKSERERLEHRVEELRQQAEVLEGGMWSLEVEYEQKAQKFKERCTEKLHGIYEEANQKMDLLQSEKEIFTATWQIGLL